MGHPDAEVERTLTRLGAPRSARLAASTMFSTWDEFSEFFSHVYSDSPSSVIVSLDTKNRCFQAEYDSFKTMEVLAFVQESGGTLSEDRHRIAAVFRALVSRQNLGPRNEVFALWESLRYLTTEQLAVFDSYDILSHQDVWDVQQMFGEYRMPLDYVRGISYMPGRHAEGAKHLWSLGVPASYATEVTSVLRDTPGVDDSWSRHASSKTGIGSMYNRLEMVLGDTSGRLSITWHIAALHLEGIPVDYATACTGRTVADIVRLQDACVPAEYAAAVSARVPTTEVLDGYAKGIAAEYLGELLG